MTYVLKKFTEGLLVVVSLQALRHLKVDFAEVHTHWIWCELLEELVHEFDAYTVSHRPGGRLELKGIESVNVEWDPVVLFAFILEIVVEVVANVS